MGYPNQKPIAEITVTAAYLLGKLHPLTATKAHKWAAEQGSEFPKIIATGLFIGGGGTTIPELQCAIVRSNDGLAFIESLIFRQAKPSLYGPVQIRNETELRWSRTRQAYKDPAVNTLVSDHNASQLLRGYLITGPRPGGAKGAGLAVKQTRPNRPWNADFIRSTPCSRQQIRHAADWTREIDALARHYLLNAPIKATAETLRIAAPENGRYDVDFTDPHTGQLCLLRSDDYGNITATNYGTDGFSWDESAMLVRRVSQTVATYLANSKGKPATIVADHPALADYVIRKTTAINYGSHMDIMIDTSPSPNQTPFRDEWRDRFNHRTVIRASL